jgi:hypothetical protein
MAILSGSVSLQQRFRPDLATARPQPASRRKTRRALPAGERARNAAAPARFALVSAKRTGYQPPGVLPEKI